MFALMPDRLQWKHFHFVLPWLFFSALPASAQAPCDKSRGGDCTIALTAGSGTSVTEIPEAVMVAGVHTTFRRRLQ